MRKVSPGGRLRLMWTGSQSHPLQSNFRVPLTRPGHSMEAGLYHRPMRTAGIDLSSKDRETAACVISWGEGRGTVESLRLRVSDPEIVRMIGDVDKVGVDVPIGWPKAFVEALAQWSGEGRWTADYLHSNVE